LNEGFCDTDQGCNGLQRTHELNAIVGIPDPAILEFTQGILNQLVLLIDCVGGPI
jgi:hypothetical protein